MHQIIASHLSLIAKGVSEVHTRTLTWQVWDAGIRVDIDTLELFAGVE